MHDKFTPAPNARAVRFDRAAVQLDKGFDQCEADAKPPAVRRGWWNARLFEETENTRHQLRVYADAIIAHGKDHGTGFAAHFHGDMAAIRRVLRAIGKQVRNDLNEPSSVAFDI